MRPFSAALLVIASAASAQPGFLDPSFSGDGRVTTDVGLATFDEAHAVAVQDDGKIVAAGTSGYSGTQDFAVVRYLDDGTPDPDLGTGGIALLPVDPADDIARAIAIQADGKIVLGGYAYTGLGIGFALARMNDDGTPDAGFGNGGSLTTVTPGDLTLQARAVAVQADGRIVLAGGGAAGFAVMRYMDDGQPDTTFGVDGLVTIDFSEGNDQATALAIQPDGRILVIGYASGLVEDSIAMARLEPDGSLDATFGAGGKLRTAYPTLPSIALGLDLMDDGRFVVCGYANSSSIVGRFHADGTSDDSFNVFGWRLFSFAGTVGSKLHGIIAQADGRIATGGIGYGAQPQFLIVNLEYDGAFDPGFGTGGFTLTDFAGALDEGFGLAAQPDGKLVLAGRTNGGISDLDFALARYLPDLTVEVLEAAPAGGFQCHPVPLGDVLHVRCDLPTADRITIELMDAIGRRVAVLMPLQERPAGSMSVRFNLPPTLPSGTYVLRMAGDALDLRASLVR